MRKIRPITYDEIMNGFKDKWVPCNMFAVSKRAFKCNMWIDIYKETRNIGYITFEGDTAVGQLIFLPKKHARKIGLPFCKSLERIETTVVIGCLWIEKNHRNKSFASEMINELIQFCKDNNIKRIEVSVVDTKSGSSDFECISYFPFKKFGFKIDSDNPGNEYNKEEFMAYCNL